MITGMKRELNDVGIAAAMRAFHKGPPGVVRKVAQCDSTPPDYQPIGTTYHDERVAIADAIKAYMDCMEPEAAQNRWAGFSDDELRDLLRVVRFKARRGGVSDEIQGVWHELEIAVLKRLGGREAAIDLAIHRTESKRSQPLASRLHDLAAEVEALEEQS
jgi:hypothetical protein